MSNHTVTTIFASVQNAISEIANVEPDEVSVTDHLEQDLFLEASIDIPRVLSIINQDLDHEFDPDNIEEFIKQCKEDEEKATIGELLGFVQEEVEFS
jgi:hypothetical protein